MGAGAYVRKNTSSASDLRRRGSHAYTLRQDGEPTRRDEEQSSESEGWLMTNPRRSATRNGRPSSFSDDDWRQIHDYVESGLTIMQIAEKLNRSLSTVASALQKRGVQTSYEKLSQQHPVEIYDKAVVMLQEDKRLSISHAARRIGVSETALINFLKSVNLHEKFADRHKKKATGLSRGELKKRDAAVRRKIRLLVGNIYRDVSNDKLFLAVTERILIGGDGGRIFERRPSTKHHYDPDDEFSVDDLASSWGVPAAEVDRTARSYLHVDLSATQRAAKPARIEKSYEPRVYQAVRRNNIDIHVRALERTAMASGAPSDYAAWWRELVRTGTDSGDATLAVLGAVRVGIFRPDNHGLLVHVLEILFRSGAIRFGHIDDESVIEAFRRIARAESDDGDTDWCETNDCEQTSCHRCWPREGCGLHDKCMDFASRSEAPVVEMGAARTALRWLILQRALNDGGMEWSGPLPDMSNVLAHDDWLTWAQNDSLALAADQMSHDRRDRVRGLLREAVDASWDLVYSVALTAAREAVALLKDAGEDEFLCSRCERVSFDLGETSCGACGERFCAVCDNEGGPHGGAHDCDTNAQVES